MKMKGFAPILVLLIMVILGVIAYFVFQNYNTPPESLPTLSPSAVSQDPVLISFVRSKLSLSEKASIEIKIVEGNYAYGNAGEPDESGQYWGVVKTNGNWSYIMSGNGIPDCKDVEIFPVGTFGGKFDQCYDNAYKLVDRTINK